MEISLNKIPITHNCFLRLHWSKRAKDKEEWKFLLLPHYKIRNIVEGKKIELTIIIYRHRIQDPDNRVASLKNLIDALKEMRFLVDDNDKWLVLNLPQEIKSKIEETVVEFKVIKEGK